MTNLNRTKVEPSDFSWDAWGRLRTSEITTLFDWKTLRWDNELWEQISWWASAVWTWTATFNVNQVNLSVWIWEYLVRQWNIYCPYFAGKSQLIEATFDSFAPQAWVVKRVWYFSSSPIAPYSSDYDGFFLESNWDNPTWQQISFKVFRKWTPIATLNEEDWAKWALLWAYDWNNFTVMMFDFLWLGWANVRFGFAKGGTFKEIDKYDHAWTTTWVFTESPHQPLRYEIRSTWWTGSMNAICSQVWTEWSYEEWGRWYAVLNDWFVEANTIWNIYALKWIRKTAANRDCHIEVTWFGSNNITTSDKWIVMLIKDPVLSWWTQTWTSKWCLEEFSPQEWNGQTPTLVSWWEVIAVANSWAEWWDKELEWNILRNLLIDITDTPSTIILAYKPTTAIQDVRGYIEYKEY